MVQQSKKKKNLDFLDMAKGLGIFLVILGHVDCGENPMSVWIYSFHLPLFFIISGVLLCYHDIWKTERFSTFLIRKVRGILIPFFVFSGVSILYYLVMRIVFKEGRFLDILEMTRSTFTLAGYDTLWFLPTLFFAEVLTVFFLKYIEKVWIGFGIVFILSFLGMYLLKENIIEEYTPVHFGVVRIIKMLIAASFIFIGYFYFAYKDLIINKWKPQIGIMTATILLIVNALLCQLNHWTDLNFCKINHLSIYFFCAIGTSLAVLYLLEKTKIKVKVVEYLGKNSLYIMCTHNPLPILSTIQAGYLLLLFSLGRYVDDIIIALIVAVVEIPICMAINYFTSNKIST